jgi:hypothetical protein
MTTPIYVRRWTQDPAAILDYTLDWTDWLGGDTITAASFSAPGLTIVASGATAFAATVFLAGGADGSDYPVTCQIMTAGLRTDERTFLLQVRST